MFAVGDVVQIFAPTASKMKYHLCVCAANADGVECFLFINSRDGYSADFSMKDGAIGGLPASPTGKSVISCAMVVRNTPKQLILYKATKLSSLTGKVATDLAKFIVTTTALPKRQLDYPDVSARIGRTAAMKL